MSTAVFDQIVSTGVVANALMQRLKDWLPLYLVEVDEQNGIDPIPPSGGNPGRPTTAIPRSWEVVPLLDLSDEPQMPAIKIVAPGPTETPVKDGEGNYRATYEMNVVAIVGAKDSISTTALRDRYGAAIAACVMQKRSLGDPRVRGTDYGGVDHFDLPADERRTKQAVSVKFTVEYEHVLTWRMGPTMTQPPTTDPPPDPTTPLPDPPIIPDKDHIFITVDEEESLTSEDE